MKLGMHASAWCEQWNNEALYVIDEVKKLGLDFIEIPLTKLDQIETGITCKKLQEAGLEVVTSALITNPAHDITSDDSTIREAGLQYLKKCVRYTKEMGSTLFTGVLYGLHMRMNPDRPSYELLRTTATVLKDVARYAAGMGVTIGIEPINRYETFLINTCEQGLSLIRMIDEPNVRIHLDTYHMNVEEKNMQDTIVHAGSDLVHIHLNENDWGIPGTGHIDWHGIFQGLHDLKYSGYASMECVVESRGGYVWRELAPDSKTLVKEGIRFLSDMRNQYFQ